MTISNTVTITVAASSATTPSLEFTSTPVFQTSPYDSISTPITNTTTASFSGQVKGTITLGTGYNTPIGSGIYAFPPGDTPWFSIDLAAYSGTGNFSATVQIYDSNGNSIGSSVVVTGTL